VWLVEKRKRLEAIAVGEMQFPGHKMAGRGKAEMSFQPALVKALAGNGHHRSRLMRATCSFGR